VTGWAAAPHWMRLSSGWGQLLGKQHADVSTAGEVDAL
jgi:hypothetical protein